MTTQEQFEDAQKKVNNLSQRPDNSELLQLYALYKQATEGDIQGEVPGAFDFKAKFKYDAWAGLSGTSREEAMQGYIDLATKLQQQYS